MTSGAKLKWTAMVFGTIVKQLDRGMFRKMFGAGNVG
jgi:hypothetical protein